MQELGINNLEQSGEYGVRYELTTFFSLCRDKEERSGSRAGGPAGLLKLYVGKGIEWETWNRNFIFLAISNLGGPC